MKLFPRKLKSKLSGSFIIMKVFPSSAVEIQKTYDTFKFKVNGKWLKQYFKGKIPIAKGSIMLSEP